MTQTGGGVMADQGRAKPARRQVNIALSDEDADLLEAIAFVQGTTPTEAVRDAIAMLFARHSDDTNVQDALLARQRARRKLAAAHGKVTKLSDSRRSGVRRPPPDTDG